MRLVRVNKAILDATKLRWGEELESETVTFSPSGYGNLLDSVAYKLESPAENFFHYALVDGSDDLAALAILELSHVLPNAPDTYLKVLSIRMTPRLDTRNADTADMNRVTRHHSIARVASYCISEVLRLSLSEHPVSYFKIFTTRTQTDIDMLIYVTDQLNKDVLLGAGIEADSHGNWLVIKKT